MSYNDDNRFSGEYSNNYYDEDMNYENKEKEDSEENNVNQPQDSASDNTNEDIDMENPQNSSDNADTPAESAKLPAEISTDLVETDTETPTDSDVPSNPDSPYSVNYNYADIPTREPFSQQTGQNRNAGGDTPKKKRSSFLTLVGSAVLFGIVAAVCFQGVSEMAELLGISGKTNSNTPIATVAPLNENNLADKTASSDNEPVSSTPATAAAMGTMDVSALVENTMPSIVSITSTIKGSGGYSFFGQYYENRDSSSCGSGFIASQGEGELLIVTNNHVITGADSISVQFLDEEIVTANVKGTNEAADLAILSVKLSDIKDSTKNVIRVAALGSSEKVKVGEMAVAIGNALGYGQSVTVGYISAKDREVSVSSESSGSSSTMKLLQTDAAINPGNSGGALMNMNGEVIGINSVKYAASEVEGMGFAIPISTAMPIINELMNHEDLKDSERGYLGVSVKTVTKEAESFNMPQGAYVDGVSKNGAADKAGIQKGDIITSCNGIEVTTREGLQELVNSYRIGTEITITVMRNTNGTYEEKEFTAKLQGAESLDSLTEDAAGDSKEDVPSDDKNDTEDNSDYYEDDNPFDYYNPFDDFNFGW